LKCPNRSRRPKASRSKTGFVGKAALDEALGRNHEVTALSRHPHRLGKLDPKVKAVALLDELGKGQFIRRRFTVAY